MSFLTVEEVIAAASVDIGNPTREEKMIFGSWVWRAESQIKSYKLSKKTDELIVHNLTARKPEGFIRTIDLALISDSGNDYVYKYNSFDKRIHPVTTFNPSNVIDVYEDEFCYHLSSNGSNIDCINIRYESLPVDDDGNLMIPNNHLEAIIRFIKYMDAERRNLPESKIYRYQREWQIQARKARGADSMPDSIEARTIMQKWMTLIPNGLDLKYNTY